MFVDIFPKKQIRAIQFLDAIASQEIPSIQVTYSLTYSLTELKSTSIQIALPFIEVQIVKETITTITGNRANESMTTITATTATKAFLSLQPETLRQLNI